MLPRAEVASGLTLGDVHRVRDAVAVAELIERDGGAQHAVDRVPAARAGKGGQVGVAGEGVAVVAEAASAAEAARRIADLDHGLPLPATQRGHARLPPPGQRLGDVAVGQRLVDARERHRPRRWARHLGRVRHEELDHGQRENQHDEQRHADRDERRVPPRHPRLGHVGLARRAHVLVAHRLIAHGALTYASRVPKEIHIRSSTWLVVRGVNAARGGQHLNTKPPGERW